MESALLRKGAILLAMSSAIVCQQAIGEDAYKCVGHDGKVTYLYGVSPSPGCQPVAIRPEPASNPVIQNEAQEMPIRRAKPSPSPSPSTPAPSTPMSSPPASEQTIP